MMSIVNHGHRLPRGGGWSVPGSMEGQVGWDSEPCDLTEDVPAYCRVVGLDGLEISFPVQTIL